MLQAVAARRMSFGSGVQSGARTAKKTRDASHINMKTIVRCPRSNPSSNTAHGCARGMFSQSTRVERPVCNRLLGVAPDRVLTEQTFPLCIRCGISGTLMSKFLNLSLGGSRSPREHFRDRHATRVQERQHWIPMIATSFSCQDLPDGQVQLCFLGLHFRSFPTHCVKSPRCAERNRTRRGAHRLDARRSNFTRRKKLTESRCMRHQEANFLNHQYFVAISF